MILYLLLMREIGVYIGLLYICVCLVYFVELDLDMLQKSVVDKEVYLIELDKLRFQVFFFLIFFNYIRQKFRVMDFQDVRVFIYKYVDSKVICRFKDKFSLQLELMNLFQVF